MKVILSKKGLDSSNSNKPILIQEGKLMPFIPIPSVEDKLKYSNINEYKDLTAYFRDGKNKLKYSIDINNISQEVVLGCHLDPQLKDYFSCGENKKFRATFGPNTNWVGYLDVKVDDIILFFGYYQEGNNIAKHTIFGYMQVDKIVKINKDDIMIGEERIEKSDIEKSEYSYLKNNPHFDKENETIYIAKQEFTLGKNIKGYGFFKYNPCLELTGSDKSLCHWQIGELSGLSIKGRDDKKNLKIDDDGFIMVPKTFWQEFVILEETTEKDKKSINWAKKLIMNYGEKIDN